jgi:soluble lytic murein transglycosylase
VSGSGALGAMQLMPATGQNLAVKSGLSWQGTNQLADPAINIRLGMMHLFSEIIKFKDVRKGLIAYNLGETQMTDRLKSRQPLPRQYFLRIWDNYKMLKAKYDI